ncbi:lipopolysaccharide biosynthesis protein [Paenibacillus sp. FSL H7-0918]|uniref:lipopolysaccharide biosynthesis protein n=1 Tax=Paenibacillus sp. FSL H7-0918 TaxID=2921442 RepID=UPI0030F67617
MNKYKKLIGNSAIFAVGNLGSKLILIFLVPLYTYYLTAVEYGTIDIITTTSSLLLPIISLSIFDAVLRFVMDKKYPNDVVFTNALIITILGSIIALLFYPIFMYFNVLSGLLGYMYTILIIQAFQTLLTQFIRAIGKIKVYALNGIIMTLVTAVFNIIFLVKYNMGINGYFLSIIIANLISILYLTLYTKILSYIRFDKINKKITVKMLVYCIPLIPNAFMWWTINASNRYFILFFVGASANGLFAVANKIPSLLSILNTVFFQAWQLSAIEEYNDEGKSNFYSKTFSYFSMILFLGTSGILLVLKFITSTLVSNEFYQSWQFVPFLLIGIIFSSFSGFLGTNYIAAKQTGGVFRTSVIGGVVNVIANIIFIPLVGTNGAGISTMISFFVVWVLRYYDTKKYINMKLNVRIITLNLLLISIQIFILFIDFTVFKEFFIELILFLLVIIVNRKIIKLFKQIITTTMKKFV